MSDINNCMFIGRLGADPETRSTTTGETVCNFRIAVGQQWKDKSGNKQEKTEWIPIVAFGKLGEICGKYLRKGGQVAVVGRFQTRSWDKDGQKHYASEIVLSDMTMLGSREDNPRQSENPRQSARSQPDFNDDFNDDIPF